LRLRLSCCCKSWPLHLFVSRRDYQGHQAAKRSPFATNLVTMTRYLTRRTCQRAIFFFFVLFPSPLRAHTVKHVQPVCISLSPTGQGISNEWQPTNRLWVTHLLTRCIHPSTISPCFPLWKSDVSVSRLSCFLSFFVSFSCPCHLHFARLFPTRRPGSRQTSASGMSTTHCSKHKQNCKRLLHAGRQARPPISYLSGQKKLPRLLL